MNTNENNIQSAIDAGFRLGAQEPKAANIPHAVPFVVLRDAEGTERIDYLMGAFDRAPGNIRRVAKFQDGRSFKDYVSEFADPHTKIYANLEKQSFVAVLDDHHRPATPADSPVTLEPMTNWREHRAEYATKYSDEWMLWASHNKKVFEGSVAFAEFLEDAHFDVVDPTGADLLMIATTFRVHEDVTFKNATRLQDGNLDFKFERVVSAGAGVAGEMKIPEVIVLEIPVYAGLSERKYRIGARFRYRLSGNGALKIWFELERPSRVIQQAFTDIVSDISVAAGGRPIYVGDAG